MADVTQQAIAAIGTDTPTDWQLEPRAHAARLPPEAGALRRVLERPKIADLMTRYEQADRTAVQTQGTYRRLSVWSLYCRFAAITIGAIALLHHSGAIPRGLADVGLTVEYGLIAASLLFSLLLSLSLPFETWMNNRALADNARLDIFNFATEAEEAARAGELPLLSLQLEYFRRYQLDVQRLYYRSRGLEHARGAGQTKAWRLATVGLVIIAAIPAGLGLVSVWAPAMLPIALVPAAELARTNLMHTFLVILGIITSALASLVSALSLVNLDQRNAVRYLSNAQNLDFLADEYLRDARLAAAAGDRQKVGDFIVLVQMYVSSEHREWVLARDLAKGLNLETFAQLRLPGRR